MSEPKDNCQNSPNLPPYIKDDQSLLHIFGSCMESSEYYKSVTPYFILQLLYQNWNKDKDRLIEFLQKIKAMAHYSAEHEKKPGPILSTRSEYPDMPTPFSHLWHFDTISMPVPHNLPNNLPQPKDRLHPDIVVQCVVDILDPSYWKQPSKGGGDKRTFSALLTSLFSEARNGKIISDSPAFSDDDPFAPISFNELKTGQLPEIILPASAKMDSLLGTFIRQKIDLLGVLSVIVAASKTPGNHTLFEFIRRHAPSFKIEPSKAYSLTQTHDAESSSGQKPDEAPKKYKLTMTGETKKAGDWERETWKIVIDETPVWIPSGQFTKLLIFVIAKLHPENGIPGVLKEGHQVMGTPLSDIVKLPSRFDKIVEDVRDALEKTEIPRTQRLIHSLKPKEHYVLHWEAHEIDISPLMKVYKHKKRTIHKEVQALLELLSKAKK